MKRHELFRAKGLPVFQNKMFVDRESALACPKGDLVLVEDPATGLVFNAAFDPALLQYDPEYQNEQARSAVFLDHLEAVERILSRHFPERHIIEVGCGKGYFLGFLESRGYQVTGIDPAYEGDNPRVVKACFDASLGLCAEAIVLRHVLEYIPDPFAFLATIARANGGQGKIYIEVPCLDWISGHYAWFDLFYEHANYFRISDFHRMFGTVLESGNLFAGQYLYAIAELATLRQPVLDSGDGFVFPGDFLTGIHRLAPSLLGKRNAIWGGASKGVIFALYMQKAGVPIDLVIDINPAKQHKFIAGTGLQVLPPLEALAQLRPGDNILVMNSNYFEEIVSLSHNRYNYIRVDCHGF